MPMVAFADQLLVGMPDRGENNTDAAGGDLHINPKCGIPDRRVEWLWMVIAASPLLWAMRLGPWLGCSRAAGPPYADREDSLTYSDISQIAPPPRRRKGNSEELVN